MTSPRARSSYHHGDLRNALIASGVELAQRGGPEAVGIRAVAAKAGVSPTAAYRHFEDALSLLRAIATSGHMAMSRHMSAQLESVTPAGTKKKTAVREMKAIGRGYTDFARSEPGIFRLAFLRNVEPHFPLVDDNGERLRSPWDLLEYGVQGLIDTGQLKESRRSLVEVCAWSAVHGVSTLLVDGPLAAQSEEDKSAAVEAVLDMTVRGVVLRS